MNLLDSRMIMTIFEIKQRNISNLLSFLEHVIKRLNLFHNHYNSFFCKHGVTLN